jgi:hypothetical protein
MINSEASSFSEGFSAGSTWAVVATKQKAITRSKSVMSIYFGKNANLKIEAPKHYPAHNCQTQIMNRQ